jgi:2-phosphosulfolactate phosphatase
VLGGERGGLKISGFHLGNSPSEYTPERVGGKSVVFTTTNGTRLRRSGRSER